MRAVQGLHMQCPPLKRALHCVSILRELLCFFFIFLRMATGGRGYIPVQLNHGQAERQHHGQMDPVLHTVTHPVLQG